MTSPSGRPVPQPTLRSAEFWASGADGVLRVAGCGRCARLTHPRPAACPHCRSRDIEMVAVSGHAVVVGLTVNHQQWLPSFPPPYVIAIVALDDDPAVRLTTNIVGCDAADVSIGSRVRVTFEKADDDIWIPLFELDPQATDRGTVPEPEDLSGRLRASPSSSKFEEAVAITGIGQSRVGRRLMVDPLTLTVDACEAAVADAGLTFDDIDGLVTYPGGASAGGLTEGGIMPVEEILRIRPTWVNGGNEFPGQNGSIVAAMLAVAAGLCRHVLCYRTVWESSHASLVREGRWHTPNARATGMMEGRAPYGAMSAANWIALCASHYFHRYGGGRETLGRIAVTARTHAAANPEAVYRDPITLDDYFSARMISSPFGLYDCDVPVDGAVAVIVSAVDAALDCPHPPVFVEAVGTQIMETLSWDQGTLTHLPQSLGPSAHLWSRTDFGPGDVDVGLLYDGFTFNALSWLEGLGFCEPGGAADFIGDGSAISLGGRLPLNPHGGQLSAGRLHGYGFVREAVLQLRQEADGRQVDDARLAVVTSGGGVPSGAILLRS
ncbi:thiolase C-terminal domain-containing protein [Gordonia hankookensis]|uniref:OB-fold domain-containing protein n=1 Tax=Gordonia hankookensis TaxID=589403 RepID=A0ABR7W9W9_9ACTN|nr:OB-fold domain-containing protein [Gordonia hankookensis]MBD1319613.1 OB-fold domain-containing protein [Gordonia hankookensis]